MTEPDGTEEIPGYYPDHPTRGPGSADEETHIEMAAHVRRINEEDRAQSKKGSPAIEARVTSTAEADRIAGQRLKPHLSFMKAQSGQTPKNPL
jgi:hypothetical protein